MQLKYDITQVSSECPNGACSSKAGDLVLKVDAMMSEIDRDKVSSEDLELLKHIISRLVKNLTKKITIEMYGKDEQTNDLKILTTSKVFLSKKENGETKRSSLFSFEKGQRPSLIKDSNDITDIGFGVDLLIRKDKYSETLAPDWKSRKDAVENSVRNWVNIVLDIENIKTEFSPKELFEKLDAEKKKILATCFIDSESVSLELLDGGFSNGNLFFCKAINKNGEEISSVVKIDKKEFIEKEIRGYQQTKEFLPENMPDLLNKIDLGETSGLQMTMASKEGDSSTLGSIFETGNEADKNIFLEKLKKSLKILSENLYRKTEKKEKISPFEFLELESKSQGKFLDINIKNILEDSDISESALRLGKNFSMKKFTEDFVKVLADDEKQNIETVITHGDMNYENMLLDEAGNIFFIDPIFAKRSLVELDFARLENNAKFILFKDIEILDFENLEILETYILSEIALPEISETPENIQDILKDSRFMKIYETIKIIRENYLETRTHEDKNLYNKALLKYTSRTIGYDKACNITQRKFALLGTKLLVDKLKITE